MQPVGILRSCFPQKFGIPRQPRLAPAATATLELLPPWDRPEAVRGLEKYSHIWLIFRFHRHLTRTPGPTVRPPRLGGNQRVGVFATRSSFRPNHIGISVVALRGIERTRGQIRLRLAGVDLLDGTPVLDIKPYLPYSDSLPYAQAPWSDTPPKLTVRFTREAQECCDAIEHIQPGFRALLEQVLRQDPRPAYQRDGQRPYRMRLWRWDIHFCIDDGAVHVQSIDEV